MDTIILFFGGCFMKKVLNVLKKIDPAAFLPLLFVLFFYFLPTKAFAQVKELDTALDSILNFVKSPWVKTVLIISLCASAITYAVNKDNDKVKRNCIAIGIAGIILICATSIVGIVMP